MEIKELQAYKRLGSMFEKKGYLRGIKDEIPVCNLDNVELDSKNLTVGHYVEASNNGMIGIRDIPEEYLTRKFFLHALSGASKDVVRYVRECPEKFDKEFFKDHIETDHYALEFN